MKVIGRGERCVSGSAVRVSHSRAVLSGSGARTQACVVQQSCQCASMKVRLLSEPVCVSAVHEHEDVHILNVKTCGHFRLTHSMSLTLSIDNGSLTSRWQVFAMTIVFVWRVALVD